MIFIMNEKTFMKKKKKLVEPKDYIILDATGKEDSDLRKFSGVITVDGLNPPAKLVSEKDKNKMSVEIDVYKLEKLEKKFLTGKEFTASAMGAVKALIEANRPFNVFIVMRGKQYKHYGKKVAKRIRKLFDADFDFVVTQDELEERMKLLKHDLSNSQLKDLAKRLKKLEHKLRDD